VNKILGPSWRTSGAGIGMVAAYVLLCTWQGKPLNFEALAVLGFGAAGLASARDNKVTSEQVGAGVVDGEPKQEGDDAK
jgi:malic enzyme